MYSEELINLIFGYIPKPISYYEEKYPKRNSNFITRFAPSPTGFLHTGSLYTALINYKIAQDNNGICYLRIEDTDTKRTIENSEEILKEQLSHFNIKYFNDEKYGPYLQSQRKKIYNACIAHLLKEGYAYPCFLSEDEINNIRKYQEKNKLQIGIYNGYSKYRDIKEAEAIKLINNNTPYVIRFKSNGNPNIKIKLNDLLRKNIEMPQNNFDIVILKQDKLPTYHFAHVVDDHFMRTTHVIRGEEWLTSLPIHIELFNTLNFDVPLYLHLDSIMKLDNGSKRKLSKRYDLEASVSYLIELGYPKDSIINYLMCLANSNYEEYFIINKNNNIGNFKLSIDKMSKSGALFDMDKLNNISKNTILYMDIDNLVNEITYWSFNYNKELFDLINKDIKRFKNILSIGRNDLNPRKEYTRFDEIFNKIKFFYNEYYDKINYVMPYSENIVKDVISSFLEIPLSLDEDKWNIMLKEKSLSLGFAKNKKDKEINNLEYMFSDYMQIIRIKITHSENSPSLYDVIKILDEEETKRRLLNV